MCFYYMCTTSPEVPQKRLEKGPDPNICLLGTEKSNGNESSKTNSSIITESYTLLLPDC